LANRVSIAVDAMSGDLGPRSCVAGALDVVRADPSVELLLVGRPEEIEPRLARLEAAVRERVRVVPATQVVAMDESPRDAIRRKKDSSMRRALDLVAAGDAGACVRAGNTGALMASAHFGLGMIPGIERPAILAAIPSGQGQTLMLDLGANTSATPEQLVQFAVMGSVVASDVVGSERPRIGLLNIGSEEIKGHELVKAAHQRLQGTGLNYIGYVEGNDICSGRVDVVVTDGFTGNVALKSMEGIARFMATTMRGEFTASPLRKLQALLASSALGGIRRRLDPGRYNGASMVGLTGVVIKSHGGADAAAFSPAVRHAAVQARNGVPAQISAELKTKAG